VPAAEIDKFRQYFELLGFAERNGVLFSGIYPSWLKKNGFYSSVILLWIH